MALYRLGDDVPRIASNAFVAPEATLIGKVTLAERASVWFGAVIRADDEPIHIGEASNIQEGAALHADPGFPLAIAANVTVDDQAMLHDRRRLIDWHPGGCAERGRDRKGLPGRRGRGRHRAQGLSGPVIDSWRARQGRVGAE